MNQVDRRNPQSPAPKSHPLRTWLVRGIAILLLLLVAAMLIVPRLIDFPAIKKEIQMAVTSKTGGQVDFQDIDLCFFPRLSIELHQVTLTIPDLTRVSVETLRVLPKILPLLSGELHPAQLDLEAPQLNLKLPEIPRKTTLPPYSFVKLRKNLTAIIKPLGEVTDDLKLRINNARLSVTGSKQKLAEIAGLSLRSRISVTDPNSAQTSLQARIAELDIYHQERPVVIKGLSLEAGMQMVRDRITLYLDRLTLAEPALNVSGDLSLTQASPAITLKLTGTDIDADATRETTLALAGDIRPVKEIFDYLRGGRVPQVSFTTHGNNLAELGDLKNMWLKGQLQAGKVSVPKIKLDLTGVTGDVVISDGVLHGSRITVNLDKSTGRNGTLQLGLPKDNDLFHLEIILDANLADTRSILQRVIDAPSFAAILKKITNLQGKGHGKLILGDDLNDINAKIEVSELRLSTNYQGMPFPISISQGGLAFDKDQLDLNRLSGSLGKSKFDQLSCQFFWKKNNTISIDSGYFDLNMTELYPWLSSLKGVRDRLQQVRQVSGRLELSTLKLKGPVDKPSKWEFSSSGIVSNLSVETELLPGTINLTSGGFTLKTDQLSFKNLQFTNQDAKLSLTGTVTGFPQHLDRVGLSLDGRMGPKLVGWLSHKFEVPETYAIRSPLDLDNMQISWQPISTFSFEGAIAINNGPRITTDIDYQPGRLQIHRLIIKDRYSDADMRYDLSKGQRSFKFSGNLQNDTLQAIFSDHQFSSGQLEGNFAVTLPKDKPGKITTSGQLTGQNLSIPLSSGDKVDIEHISLLAEGPQIKADITKLIWKDYIWEPVKGFISLGRDRTDFKLIGTKLCGISVFGVSSFSGDEIYLDLSLQGKDVDVATSYTCLTKGQSNATGNLDFTSKITARGQMGELVKSLKGPLGMTFSDGEIKQDKLLARTLEVLNFTQIVKGRLPDLNTSGLPYSSMVLQGEFQNGKLIFHKIYMDGDTLGLVGNGEIHLKEKTLDIQLLAAPFRTADTIVSHIPGLNYIMGGTLITIPVSLTGPLANPKATILSPSAVGSSLYNLAKRTIKSPFKLLEKIIPWGKDE